ncbi:hypothetical protein ACFC26_16285 [Kitasatospora purpeofusca]|uniref:hypothetical protein n=1 Tax=Kitasatospora purpeofusca TaxID=67352 RepID=UPI0035D8AA04
MELRDEPPTAEALAEAIRECRARLALRPGRMEDVAAARAGTLPVMSWAEIRRRRDELASGA